MAVISAAVRNNLLALQNTAAQQAVSQNRLATGKKVNSALDNPTNFFTAQSLNSRAAGLSSLLDGMANGIKTLEAADNGMKAIQKNIESMQANIRSARSDKSFKGTSFTLDANRTGNITFTGGAVGTTPRTVSVGATATPTTLSGVSGAFSGTIPSGTVSVNGQNVTIRGDIVGATASVNGTGSVDYTANTNNPDLSALNGQSLTLTDETGTTRSYTFTNSTTGQAAALKTALEGSSSGFSVAFSANGLNISRTDGKDFTVDSSNSAVATSIGITDNTLTTNGTVAFDATLATVEADFDNAGITGLTASQVSSQIQLSLASGEDITLGGADATLTALGFATGAGRTSTNGVMAGTVDNLVKSINEDTNLAGKVRASNDGGKLRIENLSTKDLTIGGVGGDGEIDGTAGTATIGGNEVRKNLMQQFNDLRTQIDKLAADASYNGINLLKSDKLKIAFNDDGTNNLEIQAKNVSGKVRGIDTSSGSLSVGEATEDEFSSDDALDKRLDALSKSITTLSTQSSTFGSALTTIQTRQDFTNSMINTLQAGADNLVNADLNQESATLLALNTRQQLSQTALSLASQADQAVLRLF